jgi:glycosyltransferase involved in cell wall biosynthesis
VSVKIAIVCDWIDEVGGAERVIKALHETFPDAPIITSTCDEEAKKTLLKGADIRTAWFQKLPKTLRKRQLLTLPRQWYFGHMKLRGYDVVISAGSAEAKAVRVVGGKHINICYTPTLYYWVKPENYLQKSTDGVNALWRFGLKFLMPYVKKWDLKASKRPDKIYAISTAVQDRVKKYYGRNSELLYPPTDIERFLHDGRAPRSGYIVFGRQVAHKKIDLAVQACNEIGAKLLVIGDGPEHERLERMAGPTVTFKTKVGDNEMRDYLSRAEAFIFPNEEDFGIVAVEAQAAGLPVIAYRAGGALDTVKEGVTGEFFDRQTPSSLTEKLSTFNYKLYNRQAIIENAKNFSEETFTSKVKILVKP